MTKRNLSAAFYALALTSSLSALIWLGILVNAARAQTYTQMLWGMDTTTTPYRFGAKIAGSWRNLGPISSPQSVNQYDFGAVCNSNGTTGNGTDDTAAIQAAVSYAISSGRKFHFAATGTSACRTTGAITVNGGMTWEGDGASPSSTDYATRGVGSWLYADHTGNAIAITATYPAATSGVMVKSFGVIRNQTAFNNGVWTPVANDFDIALSTADVKIHDMLLYNGTKGIVLSQPGNGYGRLEIDGLRASSFTTGIEIDQTYDLPIIRNVRFWPFVGDGYTGPKNYKLANLEALKLKRVDGIDVDDFFAINAKNCISFYQDGGSYGTVLRGQFGNIYCDLSINGIYVDGSISGAGSISAQIANLIAYGNGAGSLSNGINVGATSAFVRFDIANAEISNQDKSMVKLAGSNSYVNIGNLRTEGWNYSGASDPGISNASGNTVKVGAILSTNPNGGAWVSGAGTYYQAAKADSNSAVAAGPNGDTAAYAATWDLHVGNNKNGTALMGISNATSGASAVAMVKQIGGTANSYVEWTLADNSGAPTYFLSLGAGVTNFILPPPTITPVAIASLPTCTAAFQGKIAMVSNGTAYGTGTYGSAVSATGAVTRQVLCTNTAGATTYAWAYN